MGDILQAVDNAREQAAISLADVNEQAQQLQDQLKAANLDGLAQSFASFPLVADTISRIKIAAATAAEAVNKAKSALGMGDISTADFLKNLIQDPSLSIEKAKELITNKLTAEATKSVGSLVGKGEGLASSLVGKGEGLASSLVGKGEGLAGKGEGLASSLADKGEGLVSSLVGKGEGLASSLVSKGEGLASKGEGLASSLVGKLTEKGEGLASKGENLASSLVGKLTEKSEGMINKGEGLVSSLTGKSEGLASSMASRLTNKIVDNSFVAKFKSAAQKTKSFADMLDEDPEIAIHSGIQISAPMQAEINAATSTAATTTIPVDEEELEKPDIGEMKGSPEGENIELREMTNGVENVAEKAAAADAIAAETAPLDVVPAFGEVALAVTGLIGAFSGLKSLFTSQSNDSPAVEHPAYQLGV